MFNLRLLHLSDLHFGPPYLSKVGEAVLLSAAELSPDVIVISGDLTQRATRAQFQAARDFIDQLPAVPKLVIPGNHDVPLYRAIERMCYPHELYREIICPELNPVLEMPGAVFQGLDTTAPRNAITNGRVFKRQLDLCSTTFGGLPAGLMRIIVAHHPFIPAPDTRRSWVMQKTKRALDTLIDLNVEMILGGHLHRAYIGSSLDFLSSRKHDHGILVVQAGTATSTRGLGKELGQNSFNFIEISEREICVWHLLYFAQESQFRKFSRHLFPRSEARYLA